MLPRFESGPKRSGAPEIHNIQARIERLGGSASSAYLDYPDSLDELLNDPGVFYIDGVEVWAEFGDADMKHLRGLPLLGRLDLSGTQVSNAGLIHLKEVAGLWYLNLSGTQVTDAGLIHLKEVAGLFDLNLSGTQVTDAGLIHLKELTELQVLDLSNTKVTDAGVKKLQKAFPGCSIHP